MAAEATEKQGRRKTDDNYDPFAERDVQRPTNDCETFAHLLISALGTGILSMPLAFKYSGLILGIGATIFTGIICTHCCYVLVQCAHKVCYRQHMPKVTYAEMGKISFENGPKCVHWFAPIAKCLIVCSLFVTYFGTCSVYAVVVAKNFQQVLVYWVPSMHISDRIFVSLLLLPLILLCWIPDLKYLAPVSLVANIFMAIGMCITFYYILSALPSIADRDFINPNLLSTMPPYFSITIFAMECIGVVLPLENNMKTPLHFLGICGVLDMGMLCVTTIYIVLGFLGYWRYGDEIRDSITLNFPVHEWPAQIVKILVSLAVFCTFGIQLYVCLEIAWDYIKEKCTEHPLIYNYILRTVLVTAAVGLAIAVPTIGPFMSLIGALCFSLLGLIFPVVIEIFVYWDEGFGKCYWMIWKNVFIILFGIAGLIFGTTDAMKKIIATY